MTKRDKTEVGIFTSSILAGLFFGIWQESKWAGLSVIFILGCASNIRKWGQE